jgi:predicted amidohydrolase YtcJ
MAYQGEYFVERCGPGAAEATPPVARMLEKGIHVSADTDATRVASYNPWISLAWLAHLIHRISRHRTDNAMVMWPGTDPLRLVDPHFRPYL